MSPKRAVFLDRDGVINRLVRDPTTGQFESPLDPADVTLTEGAAESIIALRQASYLVICASNQPAAAKGRVSCEILEGVHANVVAQLLLEGASLDATRICPHHPEGVVDHLAIRCDCRKPAPGMLWSAAEDLDIDLTTSWMIGDTDTDVLAGQKAGCRTVLIETVESAHKRTGSVQPDFRAPDLRTAVGYAVAKS
jgi:D-glycero-D-manno-heptose 1,7-bisphosphate phosphatase